MKMYTKALLLGIGSFFLCLNVNAGIKRAHKRNFSASCPFITITISKQVNVSCNGGSNGSAIATASGGAAPYSYSWTPAGGTKDTAVGLSVGSYTVTATDKNGCTGTKKITITQPAILRDSISSQINVKCNGSSTGTAKVGVKGGTMPYTYNWAPTGGTNPQASNLSAGSYSCTVTDKNGCTNTAIATITQPASAVSGTVTTTQPSCNGGNNGTATANPSGGTSPYTYKWSSPVATTQTINNLVAGTYVCTIKDGNGCMVVVSGVVKQPPAMVLSKSQTTATCNSSNGTATVSVSAGTAPYTYLWSPTGQTNTTASGLSAGIYTLTVTDANSCVSSTTYLISNTGMNATTTVTNITPCFGDNNGTGTAHIVGGTSPYTYLWSTGATTSIASSLGANSYTVTVTDKNGCKGLAKATITEPTQLRDSVYSITNVLCNGSSTGVAKVGVKGGGTPYTYSWAPSGGTNSTANGLSAGVYTVTVTDKNGCSVTANATISQPATALSGSISSSTNPSCNGNSNGSISVTASGGTSPYTYNWSPSGGTNATANNLSAGSYTCTVTDKNGCTSTPSATLTNPPVLTASITGSTNPTCSGGGSATVTAGGGTTPYTYSWSPIGGTNATATNLFSGPYTVTVTDKNGCTATASVTLTGPSSLAVNITSSTNPTCSGSSDGSATSTVAGGASPYHYNWTPSGGTNAIASGLTVGTYTITVTDNVGCVAINSVTLSTPAVTATISASSNPTCAGTATGSATVTAGGGTSPYTYSWAPSGGTNATASNLTAGGYTVTVKDNHNCTVTANITLTDPPVLNATISASTNPLCTGDFNGSAVVVASGGTGAYTYSWALTGGTGDTATGLNAGTYTATVTDANSCTANATVTLTDPPVLNASISGSTDPKCNGSSDGTATVSGSGGTGGYTYSWTSGATTATASGLSAGGYTVTVTDANGCFTTANVTLTNPTTLSASISGSANPKCSNSSDGSATVTASGGTGSYSYSWTSGATTSTASGLSAGGYTVTVTDANSCTTTANVTLIAPPALIASISGSANPKCSNSSDGSATVTATGGTGGYTYSWTSGATTSTASGLSAGGYTVTVTDANLCTTTANVTLIAPSAVIATISGSTNPLCTGSSNGTATVTATGGTGGYTYSWTSGATTSTASGLSAGGYTVTVTDGNSCSTTANVTLTDPSPVIATISGSTNPLCTGSSNGSATVTASGGNGSYTYSWTSGATTSTASGLSAGGYTVTVTDGNSCSTTANVTLTDPAAVVATISGSANPLCTGSSNGTATVTATGGTGSYTYSWTSGATTSTASGLSAGGYTVTVTDGNSCSTTANVTLTDPAALNATISGFTNILCHGSSTGDATVSTSGGTGGYTYLWTSGATTSTASGLSAGGYTVTVTDANSCSTTANITLSEPSPISVTSTTVTNASCLKSNGSASITVTGGVGSYSYSWAPAGGTNSTASNISAGTYTCTVTDGNSCSINPVVIVKDSTTLVASMSSHKNATCNGSCNGKAFGLATGGTSPYTYNWSPVSSTADSATGLCAGLYNFTVTDNAGCTASDTITISQPARITVTPVMTPVTCFGNCDGSITANVTGGTPGYTYLWSNGETISNATGLCALSYTVTVTDINGCVGDTAVTVTQPSALRDSMVSVTNVSCNGGNNGCATFGVKGGTPPYTYLWSNGSTTFPSTCFLSVGTYTVTITDANNCSIVDSAKITQPTAITITPSTTPANCGNNNGSATVVATGGTPGYTYSWAPSGGTGSTANNLTAGVYTCTVTDLNGCTNTATAAVSNIGGPTVTSSQTNPLCNGGTGTATVVATGGTSPYTYNWTPSGGTNATASGLTAGSYTCTVTDNGGCVTNSSVTITQPAPLTVVIDSSVTSSGYNLWAVVTGGTKPYAYSWSPGGATTDSIKITSNGTYSVIVTDSNLCTQFASVTIGSVGIQPINNVSDVKVYPVPTSGLLNIQINGQALMPQTIMVYDITGRKVMEQKLDKTASLIHMDVSTLSNGTYLLEINGLNSKAMSRFTVGK